MADGTINIADEAAEWFDELENMKKINFFPYVNPVKVEYKKEDCSEDNCCGRC